MRNSTVNYASIALASVFLMGVGIADASQPENIVIYRDPGGVQPVIEVYGRVDPNNLIPTPGPIAVGFGSVSGDQLTIGDVDGDGLDDATLIRPNIVDPNFAYVGGNSSATFTSLTIPGPSLPTRYGMDPFTFNNNFSPTSDAISLRRDLNNDGQADTIVARDSRFPDPGFSGFDQYSWFALGSTDPFDSTDLFINGNVINGSDWGFPSVDVPLVGDFNGDGAADRFVHRANGALRTGYIDLSFPSGFFGLGGFVPNTNIPRFDAQVFLFDANDEYAIADLNGDGFDDIVAIRNNFVGTNPIDNYTLFGLINDGNLNFANTPDWVWTLGTPSAGETIHFGAFRIPEPSSVVIAGLAALVVAGYGYRRK